MTKQEEFVIEINNNNIDKAKSLLKKFDPSEDSNYLIHHKRNKIT